MYFYFPNKTYIVNIVILNRCFYMAYIQLSCFSFYLKDTLNVDFFLVLPKQKNRIIDFLWFAQ